MLRGFKLFQNCNSVGLLYIRLEKHKHKQSNHQNICRSYYFRHFKQITKCLVYCIDFRSHLYKIKTATVAISHTS